MAKKKGAEQDEGPSQAWLASYADAMTLLLAFFIMMFAFALIDEGKFFDFKVGVVAALGVPDPLTDNTASILGQGSGNFPEVGFVPLTPTEEQEEAIDELEEALAEAGEVTVENAEELRQLLEDRFELAGAGEFVQIGVDERGVYIRFDGRVLFESASADLDEVSFSLLATAADVLGIISNPIEIEGHTDNQPTTGTRWISNWELSVARSARVVRWMIDPGGLPDVRLTALGKADTKPVATNNTAEGRQENRRVEIVTRILQTDAPDDPDLADGGADAGADADDDADADADADADDDDDDEARDGADEDGATDDADGDPAGQEADEDGTEDGVEDGDSPIVEDPVAIEDIITIDPIENPVGVFPPPDPDETDG